MVQLQSKLPHHKNRTISSNTAGRNLVLRIDMVFDIYLEQSIISCFDGLASTGLKQLGVEFGAGINKRWIPIHSLAAGLRERCGGLLF